MSYLVKEIFHTLQGEGAQAGRPAVFCRFSGCNLWSGREVDRSTAACTFCDTDFVGMDGEGGGKFATANDLADAIETVWQRETEDTRGRFVVFTGGEPLLQLDQALVQECQDRGFFVAIETNGTQALTFPVDWVCVSPKPGPATILTTGNELKLAFPQEQVDPATVHDWQFDHFFLQPIDGESAHQNLQDAIEYCKLHPRWRLSLQTHKLIGLP